MICIISDTHENERTIIPAVRLIKSYNPEIVIHCGDIISPPTLELFKDLPMRFVFGNNDGEREGLKAKCINLGFGEIDDVLELEFQSKKLFAYHGTNPRALRAHIDSQVYDYVFTGHTHEVRDETIGRTRVINPGALYSANRYTFAKLDIQSGNLEYIEVVG